MGKQKEKLTLSIISPAYNEREVILYFLDEIYKTINKVNIKTELIIVDDGSTDGMSIIIKEKYPKVILLKNKKNIGQQASIIKGLKKSSGELVIVLDSDLQDPPNFIPKLIKKIKKHDVVFAHRIRRNDGLLKRITAAAYYRFVRIWNRNIALDCGDFFIARRTVINKINDNNNIILVRFMVASIAKNIGYLNYERKNREHGKTSYSLIKMLKLASLGLKTKKSQPKEKICVIGGGFQGLVLAYFAQKKGFVVTVYEKEKEVGGLLREVNVAGSNIERTYHHIFRTDYHLLHLLNSLNIQNIRWQKTKMRNYDGLTNKLITTESYLKREINLLSPIKFYLGIILTVTLGSRGKSSKEVIEKYFGYKIWHFYFSKIFENKFSKKHESISGKWFVSRIRKRLFSQVFSGEILGYPKKGFINVIKKLEIQIKKKGKIILNTEVGEVLEKDFGYIVNNEYYDIVIDTRPPKNIEYFKYEGIIVKTKTKFEEYFWVNNLSSEPVTAFIDISQLVPKKGNLYYVGRYTPTINNKNSKEEILDIFMRVYGVTKNDILGVIYTNDYYAQPIFTKNYKKLSQKKKRNYYALSMAHIYPEDRGLNEAVKYAKKLVKDLK